MKGRDHFSGSATAAWQHVIGWGAPVILVVIVLLPFAQVGDFSFVNYDDPMHVGEQPAVLSGLNERSVKWSLAATPSNLWHPLTWMSYMAEVSFFGGGAEAPSVHHVGNLLMHLLCVLIVYAIMQTLGISPLVALIVTMLYALHPLHAEPVAWISARKDVLSGAFALLAVWLYLVQRKGCVNGMFSITAGSRVMLVLFMLAFALALGSKPSTVVVPLLMVLGYAFLQRDEKLPANPVTLFARESLPLWPCLLLAVIAAGVAIGLQHAGSHSQIIGDQNVFDRLRYLPALLGFYGWRIIYPRGLVFDYPLPTGQALVGYYLLGLLMLLVILLAWKWRRVLPGIAVGGLWFLICLLPVMGFFYVGTSFSSDRYVYLALVGPAIALARFTDTRPQGQRLVLLLVLVALTAVSGLLTHKQVAVWKNDEQLFTHAVAHQPGSVVAQTNLASYYRLKGDEALAMQHYHLVLQVLPYDNIANYNLADIHFGNGQWGMAKDAALKALKSDARYHRAHFLLGRIGSDASRPATYAPDEAFMHFEQAYQLMPANPKYAYTYAGQLVRKKRLSEGLDVLRRGMGRLSPESPWFARYQLAISRLTR